MRHWFEHLDTSAPVALAAEDGLPILIGEGALLYLGGWPDDAAWDIIVSGVADRSGLPTESLPDGLRIRETATHRFAFNYGAKAVVYRETHIPAAGVAWWEK